MADPRFTKYGLRTNWHDPHFMTQARCLSTLAEQAGHPARFGWLPTRELENDRYWWHLAGTDARIRGAGKDEGDGWILEYNGQRLPVANVGQITAELRKVQDA